MIKIYRLVSIALVMFLALSCDGPLEYPSVPASRGSVDFVTEMEKETSLLENHKINADVKGGIAFLNILSRNNISISGNEISELLDHYYPKLKSEQKEVAESLDKIERIFNKDGRIYLVIKDDKSLSLDKIKVRSGSNLTVENNSGLDEIKVDVGEGITVGWSFVQFDLNFIVFEPKVGIITVNYGWDKVETVEMKEFLEE